MSLRSAANKLTIVLASVIFVTFAAGCTREVIKEVPVETIVEKEVIKEVFIEKPAEQKEAGRTAETAETTESTGPKIYKLGIFEDLTTTNYWAYLGPDTTIWNSYVLSGGKPALYSLSDQRFDWIPSAATDFPTPVVEETAGGTTLWTTEVVLKKGMKWSDGNDVTAEDFIFTAHTVRDLELSGNWSSSVDTEFFDHAEALDPYKLKIYFKQKPGLARWQFGLAFMPILSKAFWEPVVEEAKKQGTTVEQQRALYAHVPENEPSAGGYIFEKWENGAFAEKVKNPDHYFEGSSIIQYSNGAYSESKPGVYDFGAYGDPEGDKVLDYTVGPFADSSIYSIFGNQETAVLALKKGDIDFMLNPLGLQRGLQEQLKGQAGLETLENANNGFRYLGFNMRHPPMNIKAFRQAVAILIDKEFLTSTVLQGVAIPMYTTVPEGNGFWYNPNVSLIGKGLSRTERTEEAVKLLKDAGFTWEKEPKVSENGTVEVEGKGLKLPNGDPMPDLEILSPSPGYDPLRSTFAIWIERWLNDMGIPAKAKLTDFNVIVEKIADPDGFDIWILGWGLSNFPDYLEAFFHSRHAEGDGLNRGGYSNPEFDALAEQLLIETDLDAARDQVFKMQEFLADDLPYVVLFTTPLLESYRSDRLTFPYTGTLGGLQSTNGMTSAVVIK
ncbi:MAG TPA: ABC transporter substrate-binding protein [Dehalococcoidia bacterium]|jgi:ABC-type transport system substrate-binding protein|nr:ABC transporter substrate-binding protein [Chloroflexota bacterium]HIM49989.1 ABC transporter substrate-binding protein [Dehalococcoidia bacterium]|tara:strand:- start:2204 stop:4207 length:2004 start_codon:yes stop_codon:yes gene_type:complete